ncbi:hypothetical protein, partial [uncultured Gammaproteobacteria bacterium]
DPQIGRFLSADPYIQHTELQQIQLYNKQSAEIHRSRWEFFLGFSSSSNYQDHCDKYCNGSHCSDVCCLCCELCSY